jgi:hypothetical protein
MTKGKFHENETPILVLALQGAWLPGMVATQEYGLARAERAGDPRGILTAQAVVPASGHARLQRAFLDSKPYEQAMKDAAQQ